MKSWSSLGRASGEKAATKAGKESEQSKARDAAAAARSPARRPPRSIPSPARARPSSMVSLSFPSDVDHGGGGTGMAMLSEEDALPVRAALPHPDGKTSSALDMLSAAQQRDHAQRTRTASTVSMSSIGSNKDDGASPQTPKRSRIRSIGAIALPSLIKTPASRSPVAAAPAAMIASTSGVTAHAGSPTSPSLSPSLQTSSSKPDDPSSSSRERSRTNSLHSVHSQTRQKNAREAKQPFANITNAAKPSTDANAEEEMHYVHSHSGKGDIVLGSAMKSLLQVQKKERVTVDPLAKESEVPTAGEMDCDDSTSRIEEDAKDEDDATSPTRTLHYAYVVRQRRAKKQKKWSKQYTAANSTRTVHFESATAKHDAVLYEVTLSVSAVGHRQFGILGLPLPPGLGCDRAARWAVERGARTAACIVSIFGS